jgi:phage gp37-like protein
MVEKLCRFVCFADDTKVRQLFRKKSAFWTDWMVGNKSEKSKSSRTEKYRAYLGIVILRKKAGW